jgi:hypothetical protein
MIEPSPAPRDPLEHQEPYRGGLLINMYTSRTQADVLLIVAPACHPDITPQFCVFVDAPTLFVLYHVCSKI